MNSEAWLAGQLGVEGLSSPADVFEHVVGVPQGRLTADFLDSPRLRQARFDPILRTAEFQVAVERLRPLTQHYAQARHALQVKASHLEGRLAAEPELRSRLSAAQQALEQTRAAEAKATTELETANANLAARDAERTAFETSERAYAAAMERRQQAADQAKRAIGGGAGKLGVPRMCWRKPARRTSPTRQPRRRVGELQPVERRAQNLNLERAGLAALLDRTRDDVSEARRDVGPRAVTPDVAEPRRRSRSAVPAGARGLPARGRQGKGARCGRSAPPCVRPSKTPARCTPAGCANASRSFRPTTRVAAN